MFTDLKIKYIASRWSRFLLDYEWDITSSPDYSEVTFLFFVERKSTVIRFLFANAPQVEVSAIKLESEGEETPVEHRVERSVSDAGMELVITFLAPVYSKKMTVHLEGTNEQTQFQVRVKARKDDLEDLALVERGLAEARAGVDHDAIETLHSYEEYSQDNPAANLTLGSSYNRLEDYSKAEYYALRAMITGEYNGGSDLYREIQKVRQAEPEAEIRDLVKRSREWQVESHHGYMVLQRFQEFWLFSDGWHLKKCRIFIEVRRAAAARMLRSQGFHFSATNEFLLHTGLRVLHKNDELEDVPDDNFTISDSSMQDIFVAVEDEKAGQWILPDLETGDVVELTYHLLCREAKIKDMGDGFILTSVHDDHEPTFEGRVEFVVPKDKKVKFVTRNGSLDQERRDSSDGESTVHGFQGACFVPSKYTGFSYEENYLNPILACSTEGISWADVSESSREANFGNPEAVGDELPEMLRDLLNKHEDRSKALEHAFYWIRDRLKYASLRSGSMRVGKKARAKEILEAGTADCKDKSHLLSLVCRELEIPHEFLAISTKHGITIPELPAQQFDHVFVRANPNGDWVYLDAANPYCTYGSAPAWCQGMDVMVVDDEGSILSIPVDDPAKNALEIEESFNRIQGGMLDGSFSFKASGHSGRAANERWKAISMALVDQQQGAQESLKTYMPFSMVGDFDRVSDTGTSGVFHVRGRHQRCSLIPLEKRGTRIGRLIWEVPHLPMSYWRMLQIDQLFVVEFPIDIDIQVRLEGDVFRCLDDISALQPLENDICSISEETHFGDDSRTVRRKISFRRKAIKGPEVAQVPEVLERIESALQLVVSLNGSTSAEC